MDFRAIGTMRRVARSRPVFLWGLPAWNYYQASTLLADGEYEAARAAFVKLNGYRDSETLVLESDYRIAGGWPTKTRWMKWRCCTHRWESIRTAWTGRCKLNTKSHHNTFSSGDYTLAAELFGEISAYQDSEDMRQESLYQQAAGLLDSGKPDEARLIFEDLGDYRDADARVVDVIIRSA